MKNGKIRMVNTLTLCAFVEKIFWYFYVNILSLFYVLNLKLRMFSAKITQGWKITPDVWKLYL